MRPVGAPGAVALPLADGRPGLQARVALGDRVDRLDNLLAPRSWRIVSRHPVSLEIFDERQRRLLESLDVQLAHVSRGCPRA